MQLTNAIDGYLEYLRAELCRKPKTIILTGGSLKKFISFMGDVNVEAITSENINRFRFYLQEYKCQCTNKINEGLESSSIEVIIISVRNFLRYLKEKGIITINPEEIKIRKITWRPRYSLNMDEIEQLLEVQDINTEKGLRNRTILELMLTTGLRLAETTSLNKNDIDFIESQFFIKGKGDKIRTVYLNERTKYWLKKYLNTRKDLNPALFINTFSLERYSINSIKKMVEESGIKAGITKNVSPHILRHTFASILIKKNVNLRYVQALLGHSDVRTTLVYTHLSDQEVRREQNRAMNFGSG